MIRAAGRLARFVAVGLLATAAIGAGAVPVLAADPPDFGTPTASSSFGRSIEFDQPVDLAETPSRVELLLRTRASAGPDVVEVPGAGREGSQTLHFELDLNDGHIVPNTTFTARWRIIAQDGTVAVGPETTLRYADDRVTWKTVEGDIVRVHWSEGDDAFGRRVLAIGERTVAETAEILGVTETEPIDFYVYADRDTFYGALGPGTRENVGGQAHLDIRTMFALIRPDAITESWVETVVPHELVHLVFATAIENPYHAPPHWLDEGLAVYLSEGYGPEDRGLVEDSIKRGTIMPLEGLAGAFPTTRDRFFLAYAESVSAVDAIVATYGRDALVALIRSYATGVSDDEAFEAALGVDLAGFETAWLADLGATPPTRYGPQPAPAGPVPEGWGGAAPVADDVPALPIAIALVLGAVLVVVGAVVIRRRVTPAGP